MTSTREKDTVISELPRILVVDDHEFRRQWTKHTLVDQGYKIHAVSSAQQALRSLRQVHFDVVTIGEHLRGMGARQLHDTIHRRYPNVHTLAVAFIWPMGRDVTELSPGSYHCLVLSAQNREEVLRSMVARALASSTEAERRTRE